VKNRIQNSEFRSQNKRTRIQNPESRIQKKKKPLVSVVIPTYNRARMVKEAVDSVLAQSFKDYELIVIDDGSTDDTQCILGSYHEDILICRQVNQGVSAARNKGIELSSGQLIAFLDSDDLWMPEKLQYQVEFFNLNKEALICQTQEVWIRNGIRVNPKNRHKKLSGMIYEPSLLLCLVSPSAVMIRRELFGIVGRFDENMPTCEDYDMWLRISCRFPIYLIDDPLIIKRGGHPDQLSKSFGLDKFRIYAIKKMIKSNLLSESQYLSSVKVLKEKCAIYSNGCIKRGHVEEALYYQGIVDGL
jgi:glycosyltransferase involved in cell wall biosynthesis